MILRRLTEHVKAQNWFAVGIDFVIVVVGVFIGMQVANWNGVRQDRADEVYYLERILNDIDESIASNNDIIEFLDAKTLNTYWVAETLRRGTLKAGEEQLFEERFLAIENWQTGDFLDSTVQELRSSGRLGIIRSKEFREQLGRFELTLGSIRRAQENIADFHKSLTLQIASRFDRRRSASFYAESDSGGLQRIDLENFEGDKQLLTPFKELAADELLIRHVDRYAEFYYWRRDNVADLQEELAILRGQTVIALNGRGSS